MAEEEAAERERGTRGETVALRKRFSELTAALRDSAESQLDASASFCREFCQILVEYGGQWKPEEDPLPLLEMYTVAILYFAEATPSLFPECEHVTVVLEKLALSCLDLLLSLSENIPGALWEEFQSSVKVAHSILQANGNLQLSTLLTLAEESGVWNNSTLCSLVSDSMTDVEKVHEFLAREGPTLLDMRIKHLIKQKCVKKAALLAKTCAEFPEFGGKKNFKQMYLMCLCEILSQQELMQEIKEIDCRDALDMICNLESDENEKGALSLCTAFLKRQLLQGDVYCAWELTLFWSKLLIRLESTQSFLDQCRLLAQLSGSVYHILLFIKVIQAEAQNEGLPVCIEMCIQALKVGVSGTEDCSTTICKTISCLLPLDLEVKRACQLTEFLSKPTVDSYYAVETLFNEPDQKLEEESLPIPNSLRCDLLLALKTQWPFDPEFWDWKTLKRHCLALMGEEASIVSSIDKLNDSEDNDGLDYDIKDFKHLEFLLSPSDDLSDPDAEKRKKREMKKLREQGFVSARFRNWQAYMQYCVLCDKEFLGHRIVKHALKHVQDGIFRCPICAKTFETRAVLEPHVASHVKQSCKERLAAINAKKKPILPDCKLEDHVTPVNIGLNMCPTFAGSSNTKAKTAKKVKSKACSLKRGSPVRDVENTEDCSCPVTSCQKVFKYFRNLVAHVKAHKNDEEAIHFLEIQSQKAICQYCRRQFVNVTHLNDHLQMHGGEKPYFCIQLGCKCSFHSHAELLMHKKVHTDFQAQCMFPNCGRVFNETYLLYDHEAQHYITFTCKNSTCGKIFFSLSQLNLHQKEHSNISDFDDSMPQSDEMPAQSFFNQEWSSNEAAEVPKDGSPLKNKNSSEVNSLLNSVEQSEHSFSSPTDLSVTHDQLPANSLSVVRSDDEVTQTPKTVCAKQPAMDGATRCRRVSCFVKLTPVLVKYDDPMFLKALKSSDPVAQLIFQDNKLFSVTCKPVKTTPVQSEPLYDPTSTANTKTEPETQNALENGEDHLIHICPFETCTRKYSTTKSLSRHVKNVHFDAFEEWKLSRKYKRIAELAKKSENKNSSCPTPKKRIKASKKAAASQKFSEIHQVKLLTDTMPTNSFSPSPSNVSAQSLGAKFCPDFENSHSQPPIMQSQMPQPWTSPSFDGYNSDYSLQNHFPTVMIPEGLQNYPLYMPHSDLLAERNIDYTPSLTDNSSAPPTVNTDSQSSVMNEASKYVSSSLRVLHSLNGDQPCEMSQGSSEVLEGYVEIRQTNPPTVVSPVETNAHSVPGQNLNTYFSSFQAETCPSSGNPLDRQKSEKEIITVDETHPGFSSDIKKVTHMLVPVKEEPEALSISSASATDGHTESSQDVLSQEMSPVPTEGISPEEITGTDESKKMKKIKSSKRTKWPAIIKDGKVMCCRCYREFSSTKSLGGHLSKRSQCRPIDEVDLTADLPTSFLDFLNDPDISTVQSSLVRTPESDVLSTFTDLHDPNYSVQNGDLASPDAYKMNFAAPQSGSSLANFPADWTTENSSVDFLPTPSGEDGNILEIEQALRRLDLVDVLNQDGFKVGTTALQDMLKVETATFHNLMPATKIANKQSSKTKRDGDAERKNFLKPFRCSEEACVYGAMTKEALFKHLSRIHDFSDEQISELKKNPDRLSPYTCHLCKKTFTRTTGLKIHYKNVHHLSKEDVSRLKIGRERKKKEASTAELNDVNNSLFSNRISSFIPVQPQSTSVFTVAATNVRKELTNLPTRTICIKQEPGTESKSCMAAMESQNNCGLGLTPQEDGSPLSLQVPYPAGDGNPCVQLAQASSQIAPASVHISPASVQIAPASMQIAPANLQIAPTSLQIAPTSLQIAPASVQIAPASVQIAPANQARTPANSLFPVKNIGFGMDQAGMATSSPDGDREKNTTEKDIPKKKKKCKEQDDFPKREKIQKRFEPDFDSYEKFDDISLYRPYRCVHEGCVAAFSIQQNLILHYKAMHKSGSSGDATADSNSAEKVMGADEVHEFKCQVKECSKVVSKVTSLLKHYLLLHRCTIEKASALLAGVKVGTFQCDQSKCSAYFTCHLKYIDHIKNDHKAIRVSADGDFESVELTFRCECEGCDRVYTTKSNLLRHLMKKHNANFETIKQKQKKEEGENVPTKPLGANPNNGKENIASNKVKLKKKTSKKKDIKLRNHWTSFGEPSLKSIDEASAMCTAKFPLQYPCMIVGCDSVSSSERLIFKHYTTHGLTARYIEDQRSQFILCKKYSRLRLKDVNKSGDGSSVVTPEVEKTEPVESSAVNSSSQDSKSQLLDSQDSKSQSLDSKSQLQDSQNSKSQLQDSQNSKSQLQDSKSQSQDSQDSKSQLQDSDSQLQVLRSKVLRSKFSRSKVSRLKVSQSKVSQTRSKVSRSKVLKSKSQDLKSNSQDSKSQESISQDSMLLDSKPPQGEEVANDKRLAVSGSEAKPRKVGRPRKAEQMLKINPERKQSLRNFGVDKNRSAKLSRFKSKTPARREEQAESGVAQKLFSPSGLEASILKLFEESPATQMTKRNTRKRYWTRLPFNPQQKKQQQVAKDIRKNSAGREVKGDQNFTRFRNPLNLESVNNVKIVMDEHFSNGADLLLKQLQDMRPMVILKRWLCS